MSYSRIDRISEEAKRAIDSIIREELSDPRIQGTYSITKVDVTKDLSYAKVYVSVLEEDKKENLLKALKSASGYIRRELSKKMLIRYSPELIFLEDKNIEYGIRMSKIIDDFTGDEVKNNNENN